MNWFRFNRFFEGLAVCILLRSDKITMLAFKDRGCSQIFMAAAPTDPIAFEFYARNVNNLGSNGSDPKSMMLERLYHAPDAEKGD
jgi:hypothetical protein